MDINPFIGPFSPKYYKKRLASKKYYQENKEKMAEKNKKYREENKEKISISKKEYRASNKSQISDYNSQYYQIHKDELNSKKREYTTFRKQIKYKHETLADLKKNPSQPKAKALLHRIKTDEIDFTLDGPLSQEEIDSLDSIQLPPIPSPQRRKYQGPSLQSHYRNKKQLLKQTDYINNEFMQKDPNRYLPLGIILNYGNYSYDYLPQREIFKIKNYKRKSLYEKWEKEYNDYKEKVEAMPIEEKIIK